MPTLGDSALRRQFSSSALSRLQASPPIRSMNGLKKYESDGEAWIIKEKNRGNSRLKRRCPGHRAYNRTSTAKKEKSRYKKAGYIIFYRSALYLMQVCLLEAYESRLEWREQRIKRAVSVWRSRNCDGNNVARNLTRTQCSYAFAFACQRPVLDRFRPALIQLDTERTPPVSARQTWKVGISKHTCSNKVGAKCKKKEVRVKHRPRCFLSLLLRLLFCGSKWLTS